MKRIVVCLSYCFLLNTLFAQDGPGGFGSTNGHSNLALWLDANQITGVSNGNNLGLWPDQSGYENHALQVLLSKPNYSANAINGMPAVLFDGLNAHLRGVIRQGIGAPATIIAVANFDKVNQGIDDNDYVFSLGSSTTTGEHTSIARRKSDTPADINKFYNWDGSNVQLGPVIPGNQWIIFNQEHKTSSVFHGVSFNGTTQTVADYSVAIQTDGEYHVGKWIQLHQYHLDGAIAEIIVFDSLLNDAERNIIHSYLSAKYNITVGVDQYNGDDLANGNNDFNVAGIGVEANGEQSAATSVGLTLRISNNFQVGDYLLFGHHQDSNFVTTNATDASGELKGAWERAWYINKTDVGSIQQVDMEFDLSASGLSGIPEGDAENYKLLYRAGSSGDWTILASADYYQGEVIYFEDIVINNDGYYSIGTVDLNNNTLGFTNVDLASDGPGGVGGTNGMSNLKLWLSANTIAGNSGDFVRELTDLSGHNNDAIQPNFIEQPSLQTNVINGNSSIRFDGVNDYMRGVLDNIVQAPATIVTPTYFGMVNQGAGDNDYVFSMGQNASVNAHSGLSRRRNDILADADKYYSWDGGVARFGPVLNGQQWMTLYQVQDTAIPYHQFYMDGTLQSVVDYTAPFATTARDFRIGRYIANSTGNYLNGDVGEIIVYDKMLNSAERNILHAYIGAKYAISVLNDKYTGDDPGNGNNDLSVAGIGKEADGDNLSAASEGFEITQYSGFDNGDYVLFGHRFDSNSIAITDIDHASLTLEARWKRNWYVELTNAGSPLRANFSFDFSAAEVGGLPAGDPATYQLLYRPGTSGNWASLGSASMISGDQVHFENILLSADGYYTLGTLNQQNSPVGPSLDFGNNYWNVFAFNGADFDYYAGTYRHDTVSFDSRDLWGPTESPSSFSGYEGNVVSGDHHAVTYKRRSFPCGNYQLDIIGHADDAILFINGTQVWQHVGCCDAHSNVWNGQLDGNSEVELRWSGFTGDSYLAVDFVTATNVARWLGNSTNWFDAGNWSTNLVPGTATNITIPSNVTNWPTINIAGAQSNDVLIEPNAQLSITSNGELTVNGNWYNRSKFSSFEGKVVFQGSCGTSSITGEYHQQFEQVEMNHSSDVVIQEGKMTITKSLALTAGNLATNGLLILRSNATGTAYIPEIVGGTITGEVTVQRYIDVGDTHWRFLTSAVAGNTLQGWNEDFITSGFAGSDFPTFPFVSIYTYDESVPATRENGYTAANNISDAIGTGVGYWVWCGDQLSGTQPFTVDVSGAINAGNIPLPVSYTASAGAPEDGWNMVGNPYPCSIDWDAAGWTKTNINDAIYIWDPDSKQYATYIAGVGTNGGASVIASSQAFWVQTNADAPALTARENVKVNTDQPFLKLKANESRKGLYVSLAGNDYKDETVILLDSAFSNQFDPAVDARKLYSSDIKAPNILTVLDGEEYAVNTISRSAKDFRLPLKTKVGMSGNYQLTIRNTLNKEWYACLLLEDQFTEQLYRIDQDTTIAVSLSDTTTTARFMLHIGGPMMTSVTDPNCVNSNDGKIQLSGQGEGPWQYFIRQLEGNYTDSLLYAQQAHSFNELSPGNYFVKVKNSGICLETSKILALTPPPEVEVKFSWATELVKDSGFVYVHFRNSSPTAKQYQWSFGNGEESTEVNPTIVFRKSGKYRVKLIGSEDVCSDSTFNWVPISIPLKSRKPAKDNDEGYRVFLQSGSIVVRGKSAEMVPTEITIYNSKGQLRYRNKVMSGDIHERIPAFAFGPGVLTVSIQNKVTNQLTKLVLTH